MKLIWQSAINVIIGLFLIGISTGSATSAIIGVDIEAGQGSPTNWNSYTLGDVGTTATNLIAEDGSATSVNFRLDGDPGIQNVAPVSGAVIPSHSTDLTTICCDIFTGGSNPTVALWSGLAALAEYNYWVIVSGSSNDFITATGSTVDIFESGGSLGNRQNINGIPGSNGLTFQIYARQVMSSATGTIAIDILAGGSPTPSAYALERTGVLSTIPLPAAFPLYAAGLAVMGFVGWRRKRSAARRRTG